LKFTETPLPGVIVIDPTVHGDDRGFFMETYRADAFREHGIPDSFVQDNHSRSARGVLRGLHYQEPQPQGKLVRCTHGELFDVAVDIRRGSPKFGHYFGILLTESNKKMLWVPPGFAHGFCALTETADLVYKVTELYRPEYDRCILWNDPDIGIPWPIEEPTLSAKDVTAPRLKDAVLPDYKLTADS
jgi:dTDP-4-dehydrorhamnose 3,5-epimerase